MNARSAPQPASAGPFLPPGQDRIPNPEEKTDAGLRLAQGKSEAVPAGTIHESGPRLGAAAAGASAL